MSVITYPRVATTVCGLCVVVFWAMHHAFFPAGLSGMAAGVLLTMVALEKRGTEEPDYPPPRLYLSPPRSLRRRVLIVGAGAVGSRLAEHLAQDARIEVVGFVDDHLPTAESAGYPVLGRREDTTAIVREYAIDEVCLAYAPTWQQRLAEELTAQHPEVEVSIVPSPYETLMHMGRVESWGDIALVRLHHKTHRVAESIKRSFDVAVAVMALLLAAPFWLTIALLIRLTSRGPVIYAQERVGRYGRRFQVYKFRTMVPDAEVETGPILSCGQEDRRLTPIGRWLRRFRLDEIPQLWNVLRGEMSLVGPRPERPHFVSQFERMSPTYARRHQVRPGITGLAQVCGGYHTDARDKLRFDLIYLSHQSFGMDLYILMRTVGVVVLPNRESGGGN